jgi:hypothetical protein
MKRIKIFSAAIVILFSITLTSCLKDLNTIPLDKDIVTSATIFDDPASYEQFLAKVYAGLAVSGQQGPAGMPDITGIDEGFSTYLRQYWCAQELTSDEAIIAWNDGNLRDYHDQDWSASNEFITAMYNRIYYQITLCNEFIRQTTDTKLDERNVETALRDQIKVYRAEARFLRAYSYWHAMDMFGNVPYITDEDNIGAFLPEQISRADLFNYIESELIAIDADLMDPKTNVYGRVDKAAAWTLLAKIYLNADVYAGTSKYTECVQSCEKVIAGGYTIDPNYDELFLADNDKSNEIIFPVTFDGRYTKTYGGMNFIIHAAIGGTMAPEEFGIDGGWVGTRVTSAFVNKFSDITGATDKRAMFHTDGQTLDITSIFEFTQGYSIRKFKNLTSTGINGSDLTFVDNDYPVFRLADVYLMYAEAVLRGGAGNSALALDYVNEIRFRAYGDNSGDITSGELTLDFILDERARELYWEGYRRTDLIRFGKFSSSTYVWPWKGGVSGGISTNEKFNVFPIPSADIAANPNLTQNTGY